MATKQIPANYNYATPTMYVDVYTSKSTNPITLTPSNSGLLNLTTQKYIRGENTPGKFSFELAPGGINGVTDPITWTSVLTQYSFCVIYSGRGNSRAIIMAGLISNIQEIQVWNNKEVARRIKVEGLDFTLYFTTFAYYVLRFLGLINTLPALFGPAGTAILNAGGEISDTPAKLGTSWFTDVVVGSSAATPTSGIVTHAVLDANTVPYKGNEVPLKDIFTYWFETYTNLANTPIIVPVLSNWLIEEGTLWDKFIALFPHPFYEFFINTVPSGYYTGEVPPKVVVEPSVPNYGTADLVTVARVNPVPCLDVNSSGGFVVRRERWDALDLFSFSNSFFIESKVQYDIESIKNFFVIEPMGPITAPGGNVNGSLASSVTQMGFMYDPTSISKYGFRPEVERIMWWVDPFNIVTAVAATVSGSTTATYPSILQYESFLAKVASYWEPMPNMLSGSVRIPMWPEVIVGNKFEYAPFKNGIMYTFYITGVEQNFEYGGASNTILHLERGMPSSVYGDSPAGILQAVLSGQVQRENGTYTIVGGGLVYKQITDVDPTNFYPSAMSFGGTGSTTPGSTPPGAGNFPSNATNAYDTLFQSSAVATTCGNLPTYDPKYLDWRVLKSIAYAESRITNGAISPMNKDGTFDYGIMQINTVNGGAALQFDAPGNILKGAQIMCTNLQATGNLRDALARYNGWNSYEVVGSHKYVDPIVQIAMNAGVSIV